MPFDATELYWEPFKALYDRLEGLKLEQGAVDVSSLQSILKEDYAPWLIKGLRGFKTPSDASKKAIETETSLTARGKDVPIEPALREPALAVSKALVRPFILLIHVINSFKFGFICLSSYLI
jgi:hypothetical protein